MNQFKFIHCADIHLGKKLSYTGQPKKEIADILDNAEKKSFINLVELALSEAVDFIIIAGDLYDLDTRSIRVSKFFKKQCQKLAAENINVHLISGNHDPAAEKKEPFALPNNLKFYASEKVETVEFYKKGEFSARILGQSYRQKFEDRSMYNYYTAADQSVFNIGILHTALDAESRKYVPANKTDLLSKGEIHYWALGHIHQYQKLKTNPGIYYSGTIQGRNINEEGPKGAILIEVAQNLSYQQKFVDLAEVEYKTITLKVDHPENINTISELKKALKAKLNSLITRTINSNQNLTFKTKAIILRIVIEGRTEIHSFVEDDSEALEAEMIEELREEFAYQRPYLWLDSIIFRTAAVLENIKKIKENNPIFKEIEAIINDCQQDNKLSKELTAEWGKIWQGDQEAENRENNRFYADPKTKSEILAEAERLIISELIKGGD